MLMRKSIVKRAGRPALVMATGLLVLMLGGCAAMPLSPLAKDQESFPEKGLTEETGDLIPGWEKIPENAVAPQSEGIQDAGDAATEPMENGDAEEQGEQEDNEAAEAATEEVTPADEPLLPPVTASGSSEHLVELVNQFIVENGLNTENFGCAYLNLSTGETCYVNELKQFDAASTYKLPLNLLYYDKQNSGAMSGSDIVPGTETSLQECHHQSLEFSNNELSEAMTDNYGSYDVLKKDMTRYMTLSEAETDSSYYHHNYFCARQIMDVSKYLYDHSGEYQEALAYLQAAQPGQYYRHYISGVTIAQKYGHRDGYDNCSGIVYGNAPFVLGVYSLNAGGEDMIGRLAKLFYDYSNGTL